MRTDHAKTVVRVNSWCIRASSSLMGCQFGYLHCLAVVRDHLGGESDVGGVVVG
jgi:hypothetical protein